VRADSELSVRTDEARAGVPIPFDPFVPHEKRPHPEGALSVEGAIYDVLVFGLAAARDAEHLVLLTLEVAIDAWRDRSHLDPYSARSLDRPRRLSTYAGSVPPVLNVSAYLFTRIEDAQVLRPVLRERAITAGLKGTILLAGEGINLFLAGDADALRGFIAELRTDPRFSALAPKESWSAVQPFGRMLVKVKREIIRMGHPTIRPETGRAPAVAPQTLRRWLDRGRDDEGREVVLLDTRNAFEGDYGSFAGAVDWRIERFTQFPEAVATHRADLEGKTVVSFCTGGIRCEKAALYLREEGIEAFQLDGGVLGYFAEVGAAHWSGDCFVFDQREALRPDLEPRRVSARP